MLKPLAFLLLTLLSLHADTGENTVVAARKQIGVTTANAEPDNADVLRAAAANPYERKLADGLLKLGPAEMCKEYDHLPSLHSRLDAWLSRGSLDTKLAASKSPKALLVHLEKSGINHEACVAAEFGMLRDFSHVYRDQLRLQNEREFPQAGALARSIRDALHAANDFLGYMSHERSSADDMIWGQSEWLLHQAKPGFAATGTGRDTCSAVLWATLRWELWNYRERDGTLAREDYGIHLIEGRNGEDYKELESCLRKIRQALQPWNTEGRNYLLTELILLARDRGYYLYGGALGHADGPRAISLIHTRRGPMHREERTGETEEVKTGQVMVTLSSGHREIWDADPSCAMPRAGSGTTAWIKNVHPGDTPTTANQRLRVVNGKANHEIKPRGGWIEDFNTSGDEGAAIISIDRTGETWIEHYDFKKHTITESYRKSAPKPDPFPSWASPSWWP